MTMLYQDMPDYNLQNDFRWWGSFQLWTPRLSVPLCPKRMQSFLGKGYLSIVKHYQWTRNKQ